MDEKQTNHLKSYGITYWVLQQGFEAEWLLNYRGGSFLFKYVKAFENELIMRGVSYEVLAADKVVAIKRYVTKPDVNMDIMKLEVAPKNCRLLAQIEAAVGRRGHFSFDLC